MHIKAFLEKVSQKILHGKASKENFSLKILYKKTSMKKTLFTKLSLKSLITK